MARDRWNTERRSSRSQPDVGRRDNSPGRRRHDHDPRVTFGRKTLVFVVIMGQALYLAGEALIFGHSICP